MRIKSLLKVTKLYHVDSDFRTEYFGPQLHSHFTVYNNLFSGKIYRVKIHFLQAK